MSAERLVQLERLERQVRDLEAAAGPVALLGRRVVHKNTGGRVRGVVEEVHVRLGQRAKVLVAVDGIAGHHMAYAAENVVPEEEYAPPSRPPR